MATGEDHVSAKIHERWKQLTAECKPEISEKWWNIIQQRYSEPSRLYHTFSHLYTMFQQMDVCINDIKHKDKLSYSIFFHDLAYDPKEQNNEEETIKQFRQFSEESEINENKDLIDSVENILVQSISHCTEAHMNADLYGDDDIHYFLDFDVYILGSDVEEYKKYAAGIKGEYSHLTGKKYTDLRLKVLQLFLQVPNIYATKYFRDKYEKQARSNIQAEMKWLQDDSLKANA